MIFGSTFLGKTTAASATLAGTATAASAMLGGSTFLKISSKAESTVSAGLPAEDDAFDGKPVLKDSF